MAAQVEKWIVEWFLAHTGMAESDLPAGLTENYFEKGWLDSLAFVDFVADLEAEFGVRFSNEQFQDRAFATIAGLAGIIGPTRAAGGNA